MSRARRPARWDQACPPNSLRQRWNTTESRWVDGELETIVPGGYSGNEAYDQKERLTDIGPDRFVLKLWRSTDGGATWNEHPLGLVYERAGS